MSWLALNPEVLGIDRQALIEARPGIGYTKGYISSGWQAWPVQPLQFNLNPSVGSGRGITTSANLLGLGWLGQVSPGGWISKLQNGPAIDAAIKQSPQYATQGNIAASALAAALEASAGQNRARYDSSLNTASAQIGSIPGHLPLFSQLMLARGQTIQLADRHFSRSTQGQAQYQTGKTAAAESWSRYRGYAEEAPDASRIAGAAARKTAQDLADAARRAREALPSLPSLGLGALALAAGALALYAFAGGLGRGVASRRKG